MSLPYGSNWLKATSRQWKPSPGSLSRRAAGKGVRIDALTSTLAAGRVLVPKPFDVEGVAEPAKSVTSDNEKRPPSEMRPASHRSQGSKVSYSTCYRLPEPSSASLQASIHSLMVRFMPKSSLSRLSKSGMWAAP